VAFTLEALLAELGDWQADRDPPPARPDPEPVEVCRVCVSDILSGSPAQKREKLTHSATHRTCHLCRRFLPNDRFTRRSNGSYFSACKVCNRHVFAQRRRARQKSAGGTYTLVLQW
jgi:hypothetical protein